MNATLKKILIKYGYFCLILFALFLLLTLSTVLSRKSWTLGLKAQIQRALDISHADEQLTLGDAVQIEQPLSVSAAAYKVTLDGEEGGYAVLVRVTGIAGPAAVLYLRRPHEREYSYVGIISDDQLYDSSFPWFGIAYRQIEYWRNRVPQIVGEVR